MIILFSLKFDPLSPCLPRSGAVHLSSVVGSPSSGSQRTAALGATPSAEALHGQVPAGRGGPNADVPFLSQRHQL